MEAFTGDVVPNVSGEFTEFDIGLYTILFNCTEGLALELVMSAPESKGAHAWRKLFKDRSSAAACGKLAKVDRGGWHGSERGFPWTARPS